MHDTQLKAIVIGAGIAGCSTAYAFAKRGIAVTLIERHATVAQEASGNPVAMLYPKFDGSLSLQSMVASHGFAFTLALLKELPSSNRIANLCGQIQLAFNEREQEKQAKLLITSSLNQPFKLISAADASEKAKIPLDFGGLYLPQSGWVKPEAFCQALIHSSLITKMTSTEALSIKKLDDLWQLSIKERVLEANIIVVCNANDIHQFDQCKNIPITPVRGQVNFFEATAFTQKIEPVICSDHYLSPAVEGYHSIGTSYAPHDLNPAISTRDTLANIHALKKISPSTFTSIDQSKVTGRVAWRSATRDYMPLAGQLINEPTLKKSPPRHNDDPRNLPWMKGLYMNAGHGSKGMITAPICGELIANIVKKEPFVVNHAIASKLNPSRFLLRDMGLKHIAQNLYSFLD